MLRIYNKNGPVQHADRLVICTNNKHDSYADFSTPLAQHSCLRTLRKHALIEKQTTFDQLQEYKFYDLWIDQTSHEIFVDDKEKDTPELEAYLSQHQSSIQYQHSLFQSKTSPLDENDNWKTSFDSDFTEYTPKTAKRIIGNAHTLSDLREEMEKGEKGGLPSTYVEAIPSGIGTGPSEILKIAGHTKWRGNYSSVRED